MPCPFTDPKFINLNFLCQTKNLSTYCGSRKHFVTFSKIVFLCQHKSFCRGTKCSQIFVLPQNIWSSTKHFGTCKRTRHKWHPLTLTEDSRYQKKGPAVYHATWAIAAIYGTTWWEWSARILYNKDHGLNVVNNRIHFLGFG